MPSIFSIYYPKTTVDAYKQLTVVVNSWASYSPATWSLIHFRRAERREMVAEIRVIGRFICSN